MIIRLPLLFPRVCICGCWPWAQYISNKGHRYRLRQLFGALRSNQHEHKIRKALLWPKRFRRRERALLGFVLVVDLLEFAAGDAQAALGEYIASEALRESLVAPL